MVDSVARAVVDRAAVADRVWVADDQYWLKRWMQIMTALFLRKKSRTQRLLLLAWIKTTTAN